MHRDILAGLFVVLFINLPPLFHVQNTVFTLESTPIEGLFLFDKFYIEKGNVFKSFLLMSPEREVIFAKRMSAYSKPNSKHYFRSDVGQSPRTSCEME